MPLARAVEPRLPVHTPGNAYTRSYTQTTHTLVKHTYLNAAAKKPDQKWEVLCEVRMMDHEEHMGETCTKVGPINVVVAGGLRSVHVTTLRAVQLHHGFSRRLSFHKARDSTHLIFTVDSWTVAKITCLIFFNHLCNATICEDVSSMDEAIQHLCCLLYKVTLISKLVGRKMDVVVKG
ncbi:hypothetical protein E2C01_018643 [Portunus trituberculatus]|uniref:Uncharacterized protein n=1 Tax=Portunus trituberculatus TaxID=210409 RepID=A0A5B7DW70_PORTR|nr:hypothetical protein [Portunus trituberculatus]